MPKLHDYRSNFRFGRIKGALSVRQDIKAYTASLRDADNMMVLSDGSVDRRYGTQFFLDSTLASEKVRLIPWEFAGNNLIVVLLDTVIRVYDETGAQIGLDYAAPYDAANVDLVDYATNGPLMVLTDLSMRPLFINRQEDGSITFEDFEFSVSDDDQRLEAPFYKFDEAIEARSDGPFAAGTPTHYATDYAVANPDGAAAGFENGLSNLYASAAFFSDDMVGTRLQFLDGEVEIAGFTSSQEVSVEVKRDIVTRLDTDPFFTRSGTSLCECTWFDHGLKVGDEVWFAGASVDGTQQITGIMNGIARINASAPGGAKLYTVQRVVDKDTFEVEGETSSTVDALRGGADVIGVKIGNTNGVKEPVFSDRRGWPQCCAFHQGRLWLASTSGLPNAAWASVPNDFRNFDPGEGGFDDAIVAYGIGEGTRIARMLSQIDLLLFTESSEHYIPGTSSEPLSQSTIKVVNASTNVGAAYTEPQIFDGGAFFVDAAGLHVREMVPTGQDSAEYKANPVTTPVADWVKSPVHSTVYQGGPNEATPYLIFTNRDDGSLMVLHASRSDDSFGWMRWTLADSAVFLSCAALGRNLYAAARLDPADTRWYILKFDTAKALPKLDFLVGDEANTGNLSAPVPFTDTLFQVVADGNLIGSFTSATSGTITLPIDYAVVYSGLRMPYLAHVSPPVAASGQGPKAGKLQRLVSAEVNWKQTTTGKIQDDDILDASDFEFLGNAIPVDEWREYLIGDWDREAILRIEGDEPGEIGMRALTMNVYF